MKPVKIRQVWSDNLRQELNLIKSVVRSHRFAAMDTEFPGNLFQAAVEKHEYSRLSPEINYRIMKKNVNHLNPIQFGLALSDEHGNLPDLGTGNSYIWEFNFGDFDPERDPHNAASINLLKRQGIDFEKNIKYGIKSLDFALELHMTGLHQDLSGLSWFTFQSSYDFGYMIKIMTQRPLPEDIKDFMCLVRDHFGVSIYDIKHVMKFCNRLYGGLEKVAKVLDVARVAGMGHQAGSDSLLTLQVFSKLMNTYFKGEANKISGMRGVIHGLGSIMVVENPRPMVVRWVQRYHRPVCWVQGPWVRV